jgi:DNA-directed RNA polymerase specialized sigma24 family protein
MSDLFDAMFRGWFTVDSLAQQAEGASAAGDAAQASEIETALVRAQAELDAAWGAIWVDVERRATRKDAGDEAGEVASDVVMRLRKALESGTLHGKSFDDLLEVATRNAIIDRYRRARDERFQVPLDAPVEGGDLTPLDAVADPGPTPEQRLIEKVELVEERDRRRVRDLAFLRARESVAVAWWIWADRMRPLCARKRALIRMLDATQADLADEIAHAHRRAGAMRCRHSGPLPTPVSGADAVMGRFLLARLNARMRARGLFRNTIDGRWQRLKKIGEDNQAPPPPGLGVGIAHRPRPIRTRPKPLRRNARRVRPRPQREPRGLADIAVAT